MSSEVLLMNELQHRRRGESSTARLLRLSVGKPNLLFDDSAGAGRDFRKKTRGSESSGLPFLRGLREISLLYRKDIVESLARCNKLLCGLLEQPDRHDDLAIQALKKVITEIEWILPPNYMRQLLMLSHEQLSALSGPVAELAMNLRIAVRLLKASNAMKPELAPSSPK